MSVPLNVSVGYIAFKCALYTLLIPKVWLPSQVYRLGILEWGKEAKEAKHNLIQRTRCHEPVKPQFNHEEPTSNEVAGRQRVKIFGEESR